MECSTEKDHISAAAGRVKEASFKERQELTNEELINRLLDKILEFKSAINKKIGNVESHISSLEEITWYDINVFDEETKRLMNDVISSTKDWSDSLNKWHDKCINTLDLKIQPEELAKLKSAVEDMEDANQDLESVIFYHPNDKDFNKITDELKNL
jgi:hypothetical protein